MENLKQKVRLFVYPILYWLFFIVIPGYFAFNYDMSGSSFDLSGYIMFFILFISPFLFFIPYRMAKLTAKSEKILFIILGLVVPYLLIAIYFYQSFLRDFKPTIL